ncbi:MAG TPA: class I SAM-dependent methyltransferase [Dehalococcoidia bacterium]
MSRPPALPCDYDTNPERWIRRPAEARAAGDVHEFVAARIVAEGLSPVIDVGSGHGRLGDLLGSDVRYLGIDLSPSQVSRSTQPVVMADAQLLPVRDDSAGAVAALWMLYHIEDPLVVIREAYRVLRRGGLFVASTSRRDDSPEVEPSSEPTTFDAEEAPAIVGAVFAEIEVEAWDAPMFTLPDRDSVREYLTQRLADPALADNIETPVTITKRGCLVWGRKA